MIKMQLNYEGNEPIKAEGAAVFAIVINENGELENVATFGHWDIKDKAAVMKSLAKAALECAASLADPGTKEEKLNKKVELQCEMVKTVVDQERVNAFSVGIDLAAGWDEEEDQD